MEKIFLENKRVEQELKKETMRRKEILYKLCRLLSCHSWWSNFNNYIDREFIKYLKRYDKNKAKLLKSVKIYRSNHEFITEIVEKKFLDLDRKEWKKLEDAIIFADDLRESWKLSKNKDKLCRLTVCKDKLSTEKECPKCKLKQEKIAKFCSNCGYDFSTPTQHVKSHTCENCKHYTHLRNEIGFCEELNEDVKPNYASCYCFRRTAGIERVLSVYAFMVDIPRQIGKTTELIKVAKKLDALFIVHNHMEKNIIKKKHPDLRIASLYEDLSGKKGPLIFDTTALKTLFENKIKHVSDLKTYGRYNESDINRLKESDLYRIKER